MAYTPELDLKGSATLRRLAWYMEKPMTKTLQAIIEGYAKHVEKSMPGAVCMACKDKSKCADCAFNSSPQSSRNTKQM
ncbi:hypothetical protein [Desulfobacula sp.]|uniref:hypothetical protein n=1 Tax=Desulfobacula sp. TaxID=2593537 RepID=UPI001EC0C9A9|nr:hypothetical protein [Desulfobacula sp.]